ncbi:hypothetical protein ACFL2X_06915 [Candidatus Latescibacterota bacterium]
MFSKVFGFSLILLIALSAISFAQNELDSRGYDPAIDPDIDMFIGSWQNSRLFNTHGTITERPIFTQNPGDPLKPPRKAAILKYITGFSYGTLDGLASTTPVTLKGEQEVFYFTSGKGVIKAGGKTAELRDGIFVLVPEGLEFTITNTGSRLLTMYIVKEPTPEGFRPNKDILVIDEKNTPYREQGQVKGHWSHNGKKIFGVEDGTGVLDSIALITLNEMSVAHPHSHAAGIEESWTVVEGKLLEMIGKEIRWMSPGTGFIVPPTGFTPHSHINPTQQQVKIFLFARWTERPPRP